eukprot:scaffold111756_cov90-Phaeocystis_antarctica.AAC.1
MEARVIEAEHLAEVAGVVRRRVVRRNLAVEVGDPVDQCRHLGQPCDQIHHVLVRMVPVGGLVRTLGVLPGEDGIGLQRQDGRRQLRHRVHPLGEGADHRLDVSRQLRARVELGGQRICLRLGRHLTGQQQPEEALGSGLVALLPRVAGQRLLELRDGEAAEADALLGIEQRRLPQHGLDAACAADQLVDGDLVHDLLSVILLQGLQCRLLLRHQLDQALLQPLCTPAAERSSSAAGGGWLSVSLRHGSLAVLRRGCSVPR